MNTNLDVTKRFKLAIFDEIVQGGRYVNEQTQEEVTALHVSDLISRLRDNGWRNLPGMGDFESELSEFGFRLIRGQGNNPGQTWRHFYKGDWRKNGKKLGRWHTIVTLRDQNDPLQLTRPLFVLVNWTFGKPESVLGKRPRIYKRAVKLWNYVLDRRMKSEERGHSRFDNLRMQKVKQ